MKDRLRVYLFFKKKKAFSSFIYLHDSCMISQVDKDDSSMAAVPINPAAQAHSLAQIVPIELSAVVTPVRKE